MSEVLTLDNYWSACPKCWQNFISELSKKYHNDSEKDVPVDIIDKELSPYSGLYFEKVGQVPCVIFDSEKCKTFFMLKFG